MSHQKSLRSSRPGKEELSHLPLLEHFIRIRNWIFDRLDGALPQQYLEESVGPVFGTVTKTVSVK